ncbi:hypothetical protein [Mycobacterium xenopi]|uniref:Alkylmercury lyase n=2 Tax=Mycobacterium xenopi TaxID=1789 RepID=A0AAD1GZE6_MYCXE|nr:hypothetical protein [Mycobacterium xenopi]EUA23297.1 hypothetical protein I553_5803 [Mycobacterium xenopi 4042]EUA24399.1 hypothetical protein I552_3180 [Mycobacterium xenopi 3993]EID12283.1 hypothetical protein MXEN_14506 [Mycobacterium xenopi RIVM700367]MDA3641516.1 alkylmercury lyase [Mycobacterium xenopi]MDA3659362.1 alkylmercury lyase [Mycobacterium xenopi]
MRIELLTSPGCPNAATARKIITDCLADLGIELPILERIGPFPSPTVLVDGFDVMRAARAQVGHACRLDLPTAQQVCDALRARRRAIGRADHDDIDV